MAEISGTLRALPRQIERGGQLTVNMELTASPLLAQQPADIALVLDRSACLSPGESQALDRAAGSLLNTLAIAAGGSSGSMGLSRAALVTHGGCTQVDVPFTGDPAVIRQKLGCHSPCGDPDPAAGVEAALSLFGARPDNQKIILLFTAGLPDSDPLPAMDAARAAGAVLYCIGLDVAQPILDAWSGHSDGSHSFAAAGADQLLSCFSRAALAISGPGALDVLVDQVISPEFRLVKLAGVSRGIARIVGENHVQWQHSALGARRPQTASLSLLLEHQGAGGGEKKIFSALSYQDRSGGSVDFPELTVQVLGGGSIDPEPVPVCFELGPCQDSGCVDLGKAPLTALGRVVQLRLTLKDLCPNKRVGVAVLLSELGPDCQEHSCGMKVLTVPPHGGESCQDVTLRCIRFVVPEDSCHPGLCRPRCFRARVLCNYLDTDLTLCE